MLLLFEKEEQILAEKIRLLKDRRQWMEEKSKKIRAYLEKEKDEIFVCEKPGRYYLMDAFLDVSESEFAERTAELINFYENNSKSICISKKFPVSLPDVSPVPFKISCQIFPRRHKMAGHAARLMFHQQYYVAVICIDLPSDIFCILDVTNLITDAFAV